CKTPHLDEETLKALFVKAVNLLFTEREEVFAVLQEVKDRLFDFRPSEEEQLRQKRIETYLSGMKEHDCIVTKFDEEQWYSLVDHVTVFHREDIRFTFRDGTEIRV
ncbi:MAG: hypothetical protein Q4D94_14760, partial [Bacillota bacterium]|nr:hypothetical protein [Bacillota bacterium]